MPSAQLDDAAVFVAVVAHKSFSAAARALGQPKSSVSRAVSRLEAALGVQLLQRTTRTLHLTDAGARYHARVAPALGTVLAAAQEASDLQDTPHGTLRITAPVDFGVAYLADLVTAFTRVYPTVKVDCVLTGRTVDLVREGFDLAFRAGKLADSSLVARKLAELPIGLFASEAYLDVRGVPRRPTDLLEHDCVLFRPTDGRARWELTSGKRIERVDVTGPVAADDFAFVHRAVALGAGVGFLPTFLQRTDGSSPKLVRVMPSWDQYRPAALYLVLPSSRYLPRKVVVFRDFVIEKIRLGLWGQG